MKTSISLRCFPASMPTSERLAISRDAGFDAVEVNLEPSEEFGPHSTPADLHRLRGMVEDRAALDKLLAGAKARVARWDAEAAK